MNFHKNVKTTTFLSSTGVPMVTDPAAVAAAAVSAEAASRVSVSTRLKQLFKEMEVQSKYAAAHISPQKV